MTRELDDFVYQLEQMDDKDLSSYALDDVWLADLNDDELIAVIHSLVSRLPQEEEDWYEETEIPEEEEWYDE